METSERWIKAIDDACAEPDMARSNQMITRLHFLLSKALADKMGHEGGPNFHTWAVWGSQKAGETIRQEDIKSSIIAATATAGVVGSVVGAAAGILVNRLIHWSADYLTAAIGGGIGAFVGGWTGKQLAIWSRRKAAKLIMQGNRIVLQEIGEQSARFLELLEGVSTSKSREEFFAGLRTGSTERNGQDRLAEAFRSYLLAYDSNNLETKREALITGNCEIVYHEHIRLEPYICGAMPFIIRRCVTRRLMTYAIGEKMLAVSEDIPGVPKPTAAKNWAKIAERMRYVFALFREFHNEPEVFSEPDLKRLS